MAQPGRKVLFLHPKKESWYVGEVESNSGKKVVVVEDGTGEKSSVDPEEVHPYMDHAYDPSATDLFQMNDLHQATLLHCVRDRYEQLQGQYTRMGEILLSVNPFEPLAINRPDNMATYLANSNEDPHSWQIAHRAYRNIVVRERGNQSVLIAGESGAGKTETAKMLMEYIGKLSFSNSQHPVQKQTAENVNKKLRDSNPILESFGNAKTVRNDNSSRFGKYTKLNLNARSGVVVGAEMVTYLLEKSRIITQMEGERGYHVFYEMLAGLSPQERAELGVGTAEQHRCMNKGGTTTRRGTDGKSIVSEADSFRDLCNAMEGVGIDAAHRKDVWAILASIIHLQDLDFGTDPSTGKSTIVNMDKVNKVATLLGVDAEALGKTFTIKSQTKIMTTLSTESEAMDMRDAVSKALYSATFDWLVVKLNECIGQGSDKSDSERGIKYIGLLDIFGFENFKVNSFEQLCINFANEALQNHYNKYTFVEDAAECEREGIPCPVLEYPDNSQCVELIQKQGGVLTVLDEESNYKLGTNEGFTTKAWEQHGEDKFFIKPKSTQPTQFGIRHYAGDVNYTTAGWTEKNADSLKDEVRELLAASTRSNFIQQLLSHSDSPSSQQGANRRPTVGKKFKTQLTSLREELSSTESHFIRCVKPNMKGLPRNIDEPYVMSQLNSSGVLQTIAMKREGYPIRLPHSDLVQRFRCIAPKHIKQRTRPSPKNCPRNTLSPAEERQFAEEIIAVWNGKQTPVFGWKAGSFASGKSKFFMKPYVMDGLEKRRQHRIKQSLKFLKPHMLTYVHNKRIERERLRQMREEAERRREEEAAFAHNTEDSVRRHADEAKQSGVSADVCKSFEHLAILFPHFDSAVVLDVVAHTEGDVELATQALMEMQKQRIDQYLPRSMKLILDLAELRPQVQEKMAASGFSTKDFVFGMTESDMDRMGFTVDEKNNLIKIIVSQQSNWVANEKFNEVYNITPLGSSVTVPPLAPPQPQPAPAAAAAAPPRGPPPASSAPVAQPAPSMAMPSNHPQPTHAQTFHHGGAQMSEQERADHEFARQLMNQERQAAMAATQQPAAAPASQPPPQPQHRAPAQTYQQPPPHQQPPQAAPPARAAPAAAAAPAGANPEQVQQLVNMGFSQEKSARALADTNGDMEKAIAYVLQL